MEIVIGDDVRKGLLAGLTGEENERGAALLLTHDPASGRFLVRQLLLPADEEILNATPVEITFGPQFLVRVTRLAREQKCSIALLHTHPRGFPGFSVRDDETEGILRTFMQQRLPEAHAFSLVLCDGRFIARELGSSEQLPVRVVGAKMTLQPDGGGVAFLAQYDRQVRAFGKSGQAMLRCLKVGIVGLGGTGSVVAQQLAHLGVLTFVLVDPDVVEETNLNRVVGADRESLHRNKVDVAGEMINRIQASASVEKLPLNVRSVAAIHALRTVDCVFICTDSHVSRSLLSELSYQYLVPAIDIGVSINARDGEVLAVTGRTQMLAPGLPCLWCSRSISAERVREELMTEEQRAADPYFNEGGESQPAVISINSTVVSLAVTMFLGAFTALPIEARFQTYDALTGKTRPLSCTADPECWICGSEGVQGAGPSMPLHLAEMEPE